MSEFLNKQSKYFDKYSDESSYKETIASEREFDTLLKLMGEDITGKRVLDLGCGSGRFGIKLAINTNAEVIGADISKTSVNIANTRAKNLGVKNFLAIESNFLNPSDLENFDFIFCINMLHHTDQQIKIASNIYKLLKPGGSWIILENNPINPLFIPFFIVIGQLKSHLTVQYLKSNIFSLNKLIRKSNYKNIEIIKYGWLPTMLYNYSTVFLQINKILNRLWFTKIFSAFHIIKCTK